MANGTGFSQEDIAKVARAHRDFASKINTSVRNISSEVDQARARNPSGLTTGFDETWQEFKNRLTNQVERKLIEMADAMDSGVGSLMSQDQEAHRSVSRLSANASGASSGGGGSQWAAQQATPRSEPEGQAQY